MSSVFIRLIVDVLSIRRHKYVHHMSIVADMMALAFFMNGISFCR